jgi:hypothetical protein
MSEHYSIRYTVAADTKLEAIEKATAKLRKTLRLVAVVDAKPSGPPWWTVRLQVVEE